MPRAQLTFPKTNGSSLWQNRVQGLLNASNVFFKNDVMYEASCEDVSTAVGTCDQDQLSFKAYFARWLAATTKVAPFTAATIMPWLTASATGAAAQCDGGATGQVCGEHWTAGATYDGTYGVGQQMSALSVIQSNLIAEAQDLVTNTTGGTSAGNPAAGTGTGASSSIPGVDTTPPTGSDKAGAGVLTALTLCGLFGGVGFMVS